MIMGAAPLEKERLQYWPGLTVTQQETVLGVIKSMIHPQLGVSVEQYNKEMDEAMARVEAGHFSTQEEVRKMAKDW